MSNFELVHYTSARNIEEMLFSRTILDNEAVKKLNSNKIIEGDGGFNRVLCKPDVFINGFDPKSDCEEAYGTFFRVKNLSRPFQPYSSRDFKQNVKLPQRGKVAIVLHSFILNDCEWHLNYCENNGFLVSIESGKFSAPFGIGSCYANSTNDIADIEYAVENNMITNYPDTEVVIHGSVHLYKKNYVKDIIDHTGKSILYKYTVRNIPSTKSKRTAISKPAQSRTRSRSRSRSLSKKYKSLI